MTSSLITKYETDLVVALFQSWGWDLISCEYGEAAQTLRIEVKQGKRHVLLDVRRGRAMLERSLVTTRVQPNQNVYGALWDYHFLGRSYHPDVREGLKDLVTYLTDNTQQQVCMDGLQKILEST